MQISATAAATTAAEAEAEPEAEAALPPSQLVFVISV